MRTRFPIISLVLGTIFLLFVLGLLTPATTAATTTDQFTYLPLIQKPGTPPPPILPPTITTTTLTISAYQYDHPDCIIPTQPGDFVYPYPRINHDCVMQKPKIDRQFTAVILQNSAISLTVLPELGGRLYQIEDKATGRHLLYNNPVLKPTAWGWRGWWLAAGGIEWAFPTDEHGLNEYRPWQYATQTLSNTVTITVSDVEDKTGMEVGVTLSLDADHTYVTINPWVKNDTVVPQDYQFWLNGMIALNDNHVSPNTEFLVPADTVVIHSTNDSQIPGPHGLMDWPVYNGRTLSNYQNWTNYIGFFAPNPHDNFTGIYDHQVDQGIVRVMDRTVIPGHKFFGPADLGPGLWTDDDSDYLEMWSSGVTPDFWTYVSLAAGETTSWTEKWYPVNGLGGVDTANEQAALRLVNTGTGAEFWLMSTAVTPGTLSIWVNGSQQAEWPVTLIPGQPYSGNWARPSGVEGPITLQLTDSKGNILISWTE